MENEEELKEAEEEENSLAEGEVKEGKSISTEEKKIRKDEE